MSAAATTIAPVHSEALLFWRRLARNRPAMASAVLLAVIALLALLAPAFEAALGVSAARTDLFNQYALPDATHWLGTDEAGRDVLTRLLYGGRISLLVGLVSAAGAAVIGTFIGLLPAEGGAVVSRQLLMPGDNLCCERCCPLRFGFSQIPGLARIIGKIK